MSKLRTVSLTEDEWVKVTESLYMRQNFWLATAAGITNVVERAEAKSKAAEYLRLARAIKGATK